MLKERAGADANIPTQTQARWHSTYLARVAGVCGANVVAHRRCFSDKGGRGCDLAGMANATRAVISHWQVQATWQD